MLVSNGQFFYIVWVKSKSWRSLRGATLIKFVRVVKYFVIKWLLSWDDYFMMYWVPFSLFEGAYVFSIYIPKSKKSTYFCVSITYRIGYFIMRYSITISSFTLRIFCTYATKINFYADSPNNSLSLHLSHFCKLIFFSLSLQFHSFYFFISRMSESISNTIIIMGNRSAESWRTIWYSRFPRRISTDNIAGYCHLKYTILLYLCCTMGTYNLDNDSIEFSSPECPCSFSEIYP